jgi:hypothetical protein
MLEVLTNTGKANYLDEYFYSPNPHVHLHADVNAVLKIMKVKIEPSTVIGQTA